MKLPFSVIKILSEDEALFTVSKEPNKWNVISICSIDGSYYDYKNKGIPLKIYTPNFDKAKDLCQLRFDDIQNPVDGCVLCSEKHIEQILSFAKAKYNQPLIIHCKAGISRSSAFGFLILLDYFKSNGDTPICSSLNTLKEIKPLDLIYPNLYIIELGMRYLARNSTELEMWHKTFYNHPIYKKIYNQQIYFTQ